MVNFVFPAFRSFISGFRHTSFSGLPQIFFPFFRFSTTFSVLFRFFAINITPPKKSSFSSCFAVNGKWWAHMHCSFKSWSFVLPTSFGWNTQDHWQLLELEYGQQATNSHFGSSKISHNIQIPLTIYLRTYLWSLCEQSLSAATLKQWLLASMH